MIHLKIKEDSEKVKQTKQILKDAFIELYKNKSIDKINIKEIATLTGLNRGTFYIHFKDIYDLLEQIENEFLYDVEELSNKILLFNGNTFEENFKNINTGFSEMLKYIEKRKTYVEVLLGQNGDLSFIRKFQNHTKRILYTYFKNIGLINNGINEYNLEYISSGNMGIIIYWIETGMKISVEELTQMLGKFIFKGPLSAAFK